jgi:hypothetical protein
MLVQAPVEISYFHTAPVPPSYGPPLSLVVMYSAPRLAQSPNDFVPAAHRTPSTTGLSPP